jgi:hypothetical protein
MAIYRPKTIGDAPEGLERSGGCCRRDFLASRGMGVSPGEESRVDSVAAQTIEAQPVFGQIEPSQRPRASRAEPQVPEKMAGLGSVRQEVETVRRRKRNEGRQKAILSARVHPERTAPARGLCGPGRNQSHPIEVFRGRSRLHFSEARWLAFGAPLWLTSSTDRWRRITADALRLCESVEDRSRLPCPN